nr:phage-related protein tail component-like protein [uncultured Mediterranean phage uvMED]BAR26437.1 phage-related protein tail component-like protein [uncultured Mediterranean phage uvMED]
MTVIRGSGGGSKGGGNRTPVEADDSLQSIQMANVVDLVSEGEVAGLDDGFKSIYLDGTPVQDANGNNNFEGYQIETRNGTQSQPYISSLAANEIERTNIGLPVQLTFGNTTIKQITNTAASKVRVTISIPTLRQIEDDGDIVGHSVIIKIRAQYNGGGYNLVKQDEIKGKSSNNYQRDYVFPLTGAFPVDIEVSRVSADDPNSKKESKTFWSGVTEIIDEKLSYPNSALVFLRFDSRQFSNIPSRKYLLRGVKTQLPSNAQVDTTTHIGRVTYSGVWDGTFGAAQWHSDPSWHLYNLLVNDRYGVGLDAATLDKFDFYTISQYCNQLVNDHKGGQEVRMALNMVINTRKAVYDTIKEITAIFRGMSYYGAGSLVVVQDSPQTSKYLLGAANVVDGNFEYTGTSQKARHTTCTVAYQSYDKLGETEFEYVEDVDAVAKNGVINKQIKALGCYSQGQAHRIGLWTLQSEKLLTNTVSFSVAVDSGIVLRPSMVIDIADELKSGYRHTGYVSTGSTATVIKIDSGANISIDLTKNPEISILLSTGLVEKKSIQNIDTATKSVTVTSAFSEIPNAQSVYILQTSEVQTQQFRVVEISEQDKGIYSVIALQYNSSIYNFVDNGDPITVRNITNLDAAPDPVTDIEDQEFLYSDGQGVFVGCDLSWQHNMKRVSEFRITYRVDNDNWASVRTSSPSISLRQGGNFGALRAGTLQVQIQAVNYLNKGSTIANHTVPLAGKTAAPADMVNFTMIPTNGLARLQWTQSTDLDVVVGGLVRLKHSPDLSGVTWANATSIHSDLTGTAKEAYADLKQGTYLAKFVDSGGRTSVNAAYVEFSKPDLGNLYNINTQTEQTSFTGTKTNVTVTSGELVMAANGSVLHTNGTYLFANNPIDLGDVFSIELESLLKVRSFFPNAITINQMGLDFDPNAAANTTGFAALSSFVGDTPTNTDVKLYLRTTQTDPNSSPTWTSWRPFNNAEFKARGYELKAELETNDSTAQLAIQTLEVSSNMPLRTINGTGTTLSNADYTITFTNKFAATPVIGITFSATNSGDYYNISSSSANSFSVSIYNSGNIRQARSFSWTATGYGKG